MVQKFHAGSFEIIVQKYLLKAPYSLQKSPFSIIIMPTVITEKIPCAHQVMQQKNHQQNHYKKQHTMQNSLFPGITVKHRSTDKEQYHQRKKFQCFISSHKRSCSKNTGGAPVIPFCLHHSTTEKQQCQSCPENIKSITQGLRGKFNKNRMYRKQHPGGKCNILPFRQCPGNSISDRRHKTAAGYTKTFG